MRARSRWTLAAILVLLSMSSSGCQRTKSDADQTSRWLEQGAQLLSSAAMDGFTSATTWDLENARLELDDDRFPDWGRDRFDACVYWRATFSTRALNNDRRPGNSEMYIQRAGSAWGWALVAADTAHILEVAYAYDGSENPPHVTIDGWQDPS